MDTPLNQHKKNNLLIGFLNLGILVSYRLLVEVRSGTLLHLVELLIVVTMVAILAVWFEGAFSKILNNIQVSLFSVLFLFIVLEIIAIITPQVIPLQVLNFFATADINKERASSVMFIDQNPYVQFKPNTIVKSQNFRGNDSQFVYEWKTDKNGFKNSNEISNMDEVFAVAVGDSFTEGMGVSTDNVWPSILSGKGYPTYNLGVQGYAPTQMLGSFELYGSPLKPKYVFIGYTSHTEHREKAFYSVESAKRKKNFAGGIQSSVEIRYQAKFLTSAIFLLAREAWTKYRRGLTGGGLFDYSPGNAVLRRYKPEINRFEKWKGPFEFLETSPEWLSTLNKFSDIISLAESINSKVVFIYFPHRAEMYFERIKGEKLPISYFGRKEIELLKQFTKPKNVAFLDLSDKFRYYVNSLPQNADIKMFPYLEIDAHLSKVGNRLVAEAIMKILPGQTAGIKKF